MFAEHPVAGVGHGAFRAEFARTKLAMAPSGEPFYAATWAHFVNAHNEYLEVGAETGCRGCWRSPGGGGARVGGAAPPAGGGPCRWRARLGGPRGDRLLALAYFPFRVALVAFG